MRDFCKVTYSRTMDLGSIGALSGHAAYFPQTSECEFRPPADLQIGAKAKANPSLISGEGVFLVFLRLCMY